MLKAGSKPRMVERVSRKAKPKRVQIEVKHVATIRVQLGEIREAAEGTRTAARISAATEKIAALLPG